jgi:hypothetical protein
MQPEGKARGQKRRPNSKKKLSLSGKHQKPLDMLVNLST